jgi:hypothetical protein
MKKPTLPLGRSRRSEAGFAVLMIYSMAAIVAIMLFMQLPRVAFEAQREKEQLLIDHGEQYKRAIQLYVRKFNKFPPDFEALNNTQNMRFLRHKYIDPMTGKDDWRIVHVGPGGVFTDSLIHKADPNKQQKEQQNFITEIQQTGGNPVDANQGGVNVATRQRPSDQAGAPGDPNNPVAPQPPQLDQNGNPIQGGAGTVLPGQPFPGQPGMPGQPRLPGQPGFPFQPGQFNSNGTPQAPGQPFPGTVPQQFQQNQFNQNQFNQQQTTGQFGAQPGQQVGGPPSGAASLINQLLTTPRPGGLNGVGGVQQGLQGTLTGPPGTPIPATAQTVIGGGIAGVASKLEVDGIKVYNDQTSYNKWEFVYDITKDPARTGATAIPVQNGAPQNGQPQQNGAVTGQSAMPGFGATGGGFATTGQAPPPPPPPPPTGVTPQ